MMVRSGMMIVGCVMRFFVMRDLGRGMRYCLICGWCRLIM